MKGWEGKGRERVNGVKVKNEEEEEEMAWGQGGGL